MKLMIPLLRMKSNNVYVYIISTCIILFSWIFLIHPFEIPDEQSHYATVHYFVDKGIMPDRSQPNLSLEEQETEYLLGIMTDGTNKYARNPDYKPEFTNSYIGKYEQEIEALNNSENRSTYTIHQAAIYPPLYYQYSSLFYKLVNDSSLIFRLYVTRIGSLILTAISVYLAYLIGREIFHQKKWALSLALLTLFYPMTAFMGVGVNSDNLHNLLFAAFTLLAIKLIKSGWNINLSLAIGTIIGLDMITKPQAYIMLPVLAGAVLVRWKWHEWKTWFKHGFFILVPILLIAGWQEIPKFIGVGGNPYAIAGSAVAVGTDFTAYSTGFVKTLTQEMIVWYWGVFKWQGVLLPRMWWWTAIRLMGLAGIGIILKLYRDWKKKKLSWVGRMVIFSILANLIYAAALFWFDWQFYQRTGRSLGMQARYYMPLLVTQMALMLIGLTELGWNERVKEWIRRGLILFFLGLQLTAIYTVASSYYDLSSLSSFITQASQYKPWFAKGNWWYLWITGYLGSIIYLTKQALKPTHSV